MVAYPLRLVGDVAELRALLDAAARNLQRSASFSVVAPFYPAHQQAPAVIRFIRKWADYSEKYGIGYLTSDGAVGAFFNDASKMLLSPSGTRIGSIEKNQLMSFPVVTNGKSGLTHDLSKKVTLIKYFQDVFLPDRKLPTTAAAVAGQPDEYNRGVPFFMTHYYRTNTAIVFRFSTGHLQANFTDHTKMVIVPWWRNPVRFPSLADDKLAGIAEDMQGDLQPPQGKEADSYVRYISQLLAKLLERFKKSASSSSCSTAPVTTTTATAVRDRPVVK
jgi:hypothetical protein